MDYLEEKERIIQGTLEICAESNKFRRFVFFGNKDKMKTAFIRDVNEKIRNIKMKNLGCITYSTIEKYCGDTKNSIQSVCTLALGIAALASPLLDIFEAAFKEIKNVGMFSTAYIYSGICVFIILMGLAFLMILSSRNYNVTVLRTAILLLELEEELTKKFKDCQTEMGKMTEEEIITIEQEIIPRRIKRYKNNSISIIRRLGK